MTKKYHINFSGFTRKKRVKRECRLHSAGPRYCWACFQIITFYCSLRVSHKVKIVSNLQAIHLISIYEGTLRHLENSSLIKYKSKIMQLNAYKN